MTDKEKKAIEKIEDFLTTNIIVSISNDETADSEELKVFISKNEYLAIEFILTMFLKQQKEIEKIIQILEAKPYTAYTLYGDILHESDEIAQMLKELLEKEEVYENRNKI